MWHIHDRKDYFKIDMMDISTSEKIALRKQLRKERERERKILQRGEDVSKAIFGQIFCK